MQALAKKEEGWQPEADDKSFKVESNFFLTGVSDRSLDYGPLEGLKLGRHGTSSI